jgi:c-di-GMP-binding flagellar brake protein YcgR
VEGVQRREFERYRLWFPAQLESNGGLRMAMTHNIGAGGMLMVFGAGLEVGESVKVTFRLPSGEREQVVQGKVLRIEPNAEDPEGAWPLRVAIAFDEVDPELAPVLQSAADRFGA